jgi:hypothetical protein
MDDKDRARKIADLWSDGLTQSEQDDLAAEILAAFAAIREECAKVAETYRLEAGEGNQITLSGFVGRRIAEAIRTAQPARKAQEGA